MEKNKVIEITEEGLKDKKREYDELINVILPDDLEKLNAAREMGDLSENADYKFAKEKYSRDLADKSRLEFILENYKIVKVKETDKTVLIGKKVDVRRVDNGKEFSISIVSTYEVDLSNADKLKISPNSPIGSALLGHKIGDQVLINAKVPYEVEILNITNSK